MFSVVFFSGYSSHTHQNGQLGSSLPFTVSWNAHCTHRPCWQLETTTLMGVSMQMGPMPRSSSSSLPMLEPSSCVGTEETNEYQVENTSIIFAPNAGAIILCRHSEKKPMNSIQIERRAGCLDSVQNPLVRHSSFHFATLEQEDDDR